MSVAIKLPKKPRMTTFTIVAGAPSETGSLLVVEKRQGPYTGEKEKVLELDALMEEEGGDFYLFHKHKKILRITSAI